MSHPQPHPSHTTLFCFHPMWFFSRLYLNLLLRNHLHRTSCSPVHPVTLFLVPTCPDDVLGLLLPHKYTSHICFAWYSFKSTKSCCQQQALDIHQSFPIPSPSFASMFVFWKTLGFTLSQVIFQMTRADVGMTKVEMIWFRSLSSAHRGGKRAPCARSWLLYSLNPEIMTLPCSLVSTRSIITHQKWVQHPGTGQLTLCVPFLTSKLSQGFIQIEAISSDVSPPLSWVSL